MIRNLDEKKHAENRIYKLEKIILNLKYKLCPEREEDFKRMAYAYQMKIQELREEIDVFLGTDIFLIPQEDINIHIKGPLIEYGQIPISLISKYLDDFKNVMQKFLNEIQGKKITKTISKRNDFVLTALQPGSINLALKMPNISNQLNIEGKNSFKESLKLYFEVLNWISDEKEKPSIPDERLEILLTSIIKTLPDNKRITSIDFSGKEIKTSRIYVNGKTREAAKNKLKLIKESESNIRVNGVLREVDLDKKTFKLRNFIEGQNEWKCKIKDNLDIELVEFLNKNIEVIGKKETNNSIIVLNIIENQN